MYNDVKCDAGAQLRAWRTRSGLTQLQVARRLRITVPMVSEYERGAKRPSSGIMARIQVLTGLPMIAWHPDAESEVRAA